jgi:hypothetical protein
MITGCGQRRPLGLPDLPAVPAAGQGRRPAHHRPGAVIAVRRRRCGQAPVLPPNLENALPPQPPSAAVNDAAGESGPTSPQLLPPVSPKPFVQNPRLNPEAPTQVPPVRTFLRRKPAKLLPSLFLPVERHRKPHANTPRECSPCLRTPVHHLPGPNIVLGGGLREVILLALEAPVVVASLDDVGDRAARWSSWHRRKRWAIPDALGPSGAPNNRSTAGLSSCHRFVGSGGHFSTGINLLACPPSVALARSSPNSG